MSGCRSVVATAGGASRCRWRIVRLSCPTGQVCVLCVAGEVDRTSMGLLRAGLAKAFTGRPDHVMIDLAEMSFCSAQGMDELVEAGRWASDSGVDYRVSGASRQVERCWSHLWAADLLPARFPNAKAALLAIGVQPDAGSDDQAVG